MLDSSKFIRHLFTSPKHAVQELFAAHLSRKQVITTFTLLAGECIAFASCMHLLTHGAVSTGCTLVGSSLVLVLFASIALLFSDRKWRAALAWEAIIQFPAAIIATTCAIVLFGFKVSQSMTLFVHPYLSGGIGIVCTLWIIVSRFFGREARHVYTGSLLDVIMPVVKLVIDAATIAGAVAILLFVHFSS